MKRNFPNRAVHLDFHTMPGIPDIGKDFDGKAFAATLKKAGVEFITVFARCNLGFSYYPTKIGTVYPGLKKDLLGGMVSACQKQGIQVAAYFNAGYSHEEALRHRDWCKVNESGQVYEFDRLGTHSFRQPCLNTGYGEHLLAMVEEVLEAYPVDGLFLDCFRMRSPCYGIECIEGMKKEGLNPLDEQDALRYNRKITLRYRERVEKLARKKDRGIWMYFNSMPYACQPTHLELEVLPTGSWGYDTLPWSIRYARTLGKPYFTMTGRFHKSWGDFGGLRPFPSLLYDCWNSLANGGTCSVGDHLHPRGQLDREVYAHIGKAYTQVRAVEPWTTGASALADMAIVDPTLKNYPGIVFRNKMANVAGASRMLMELKAQFDVSNGEGDLSKYKVILLPDRVTVDNALGKKLESCIEAGAAIISSGASGLTPDRKNFALRQHWPVFEGEEPHNPSYFKAVGAFAAGLPRMPVTIYNPGVAMRAKKSSAVLARLYRPYFNRGSWDGFHDHLYTPPDKSAGRPALVRTGNVFHFSFPIFEGYFEHAVIAYKQLMAHCLHAALDRPLLKTKNMPSFGQATVTQLGRRRMVHLLSYVPELRGKTQVIEEPISARNVEIALRHDGTRINRVYLAPSRENLDFHVGDDYTTVSVPDVNGYALVVFE